MGDFKGSGYPHIYIFPRSIDTLFERVDSKFDLDSVPNYEVYYQDQLKTYEDSIKNKLPEMAKSETNEVTTLKEIENRIYVDLWNDSMPERQEQGPFEIKRKITIGFLKKEGKNNFKSYQHLEETPNFKRSVDEVQLVVAVEPKDTKKYMYIEGIASSYKFTSENSPKKCAYIPVDKMLPEYLVECTLHIFCTHESIKQEEEIEITAQLIHKKRGRDKEIDKKSALKMALYRCPQPKDDDPFESLKDKEKDKDIFVMPRLCQEERHEAYIKKLQLYSNQVLARHKKMEQKNSPEVQDNKFDFVKEDGLYTPQLGVNYGMSVKIFQETKKPNPLPKSGLYAVMEYNLSTFGQSHNFVEFMASNYGIDEKIVRKIAIDKNFIYGQDQQETKIEKIQGIKNIHDRIVRQFRERIILHAQKYVDFPHRWMPKPNKGHYNRGKLTVENGMNLLVYNQKEGGSAVQVGNIKAGTCLPKDVIITFVKGCDEYCNNSTETHRYKIAGIRINGQNYPPHSGNEWFIPLTYEIKKKCMDIDYLQNYCDYMVLPTVGKDREYLEYYKNHNGVPYYISELNEKRYGGKVEYDTFFSRLNVPNIRNWYSYNDNPYASKPNMPNNNDANQDCLKGIGLDCSGFIMNCLLDTTYDDITKTPFLKTEDNNLRPNGETAYNLGNDRARRIPLDSEYKNGEELLVQAGDLIYSQEVGKNDGRHIALCAIDFNEVPNLDVHLTECQKNEKYFAIIHNYGGTGIFLENKKIKWTDGFFCKTLKGPFQHWGVELNNKIGWPNSYAGRIFLWY
jgi:hypothetical protein